MSFMINYIGFRVWGPGFRVQPSGKFSSEAARSPTGPAPYPRPPDPNPQCRPLFLLALAESGSRRCAASLRSPTQSTSPSVVISCTFSKLEFVSLLSTLIVFLPRLFPPPSSYSSPPSVLFLSLIPSLQSFRTTVSCSKLAPAVRWPSLFAAGPRRTT